MNPQTPPDALIVVDYQNGFIPVNEGGTGELGVEGGGLLAPRINELIKETKNAGGLVIGTRDWHPENHVSFASQYSDKEPFDILDSGQVLWPDHCIANTASAYYHESLAMERIDHHIIKGYEADREAYSGFEGREFDSESKKLTDILRNAGVKAVKVVGLATDYCVNATALDALKNGFNVKLIQDAIAGVDPAESVKVLEALREQGVDFV